jgi:hypothetical protein
VLIAVDLRPKLLESYYLPSKLAGARIKIAYENIKAKGGLTPLGSSVCVPAFDAGECLAK